MTTAATSSGDDSQMPSRIVTSDDELDDDEWRPSSADQRKRQTAHDPEAEKYTEANRDAEAEIFAELAKVDFRGPVWDAFALPTAEYIASVLTGWICSSALSKILSAKFIPFWFTHAEIEDLITDECHRTSVVSLACYEALRKFADDARAGKGWSPAKGASMATWMTTSALYQVVNQYKSWRSAADRYRQATIAVEAEFPELNPNPARALSVGNDVAQRVVNTEALRRHLSTLSDQDRKILWGRLNHQTYQEIAQLDGHLDSRAVGRRWHRLKADNDWIRRLDEEAER